MWRKNQSMNDVTSVNHVDFFQRDRRADCVAVSFIHFCCNILPQNNQKSVQNVRTSHPPGRPAVSLCLHDDAICIFKKFPHFIGDDKAISLKMAANGFPLVRNVSVP